MLDILFLYQQYLNAVGGSSKEGIESIRKNAPFQYASQNRMVTAADYSALILKNFSTFISDIQSFGGEDASRTRIRCGVRINTL